MERLKHCPKCQSVNIINTTDDETPDGTLEFWVCLDCMFQYGIELKISAILTDEGNDMSNVIKLNDNEKSYFLGCHEIALNDDGSVKGVQILKVGKFEHPVYGTFEITPKVLHKLKENFDGKIRKVDLAFNYEHGESKAHGTKAAGWIKSLSVKNDSELWANADWTPEGKKALGEREYRYTSAEFLPKYRDAESGKSFDWVLIGAALTNKPFVKGMQAIAAHERNKTDTKGVKKSMNLTELIAELAKLGIDFNEMKKKSESFDALTADKVKLSEELTNVSKEKADLAAKNAELTEKVELAEKEKAELKFAELVKKGMESGKLTKAMADGTFKQMFEKNGAEFCETFLSEAQKIVDVGDEKGSNHNDQKDSNNKKSASEQILELAEKKAKEDKISIADASLIVLSENPELAEKYENEANHS